MMFLFKNFQLDFFVSLKPVNLPPHFMLCIVGLCKILLNFRDSKYKRSTIDFSERKDCL